jgi:amino acid transporter
MTTLARRLGFGALVVYGIGDILGAGIYALVGTVINIAGTSAWISFVIAALVALVTGISYAELTARYPVSAGAAAFVRRAFPGRLIATLTGVLVLGTGLASAATVSRAFSGYLQELVSIPAPLAQIILISGISFLSFWGIQESSRVNFFLTFVEASGLLAVIITGIFSLNASGVRNLGQSSPGFLPILSGVTIAFYAYIGFEDLANLAEECKNPTRELPRAILIAIAVTTVIYILVALVLLMSVPLDSISKSEKPLLLVFEGAGLQSVLRYFSLIAILAITNTGLINLIMASRLMYGMSQEGLLPRLIGTVHRGRQTPWVGVLIAYLAVLLLVFTGGLKILAQTTSLLILIVFLMVHLSLIRVKWQKIEHEGIQFPIFSPILGALLCLVIMTRFPLEIFARSTILVGVGLVIWASQLGNKNLQSS